MNVCTSPSCAHGPTLLFERLTKNGTKRKFYACAACRNRKDCRFFQWADSGQDTIRKTTLKNSSTPIDNLMQFTHADHVNRLKQYRQLPHSQRQICESCSQIVLPHELASHKYHELISNITDAKLLTPSYLLQPIKKSRKEAQFFFSKRTTDFILSIFKNLEITSVLCVGCPRIHECISVEESMSSFLLDLDHRFCQFYSLSQFCRYNMFNHYFFDGEEGKQAYMNFLSDAPVGKTAVILDPPFGGLVKPLVHSLKVIQAEWMQHRQAHPKKELPFMWIFPYFMEMKILAALPAFKMLDYEVDYDNHPLYKSKNAGGRRVSPIRIFTNIAPVGKIVLPANEGYRYCDMCKRYVSSANIHCNICGICPSKDGRAYNHCGPCKRCVKASHAHCETCGQCHNVEHTCSNAGNTDGHSYENLKHIQKRYAKHQKFCNSHSRNKQKRSPTREQRCRKHK